MNSHLNVFSQNIFILLPYPSKRLNAKTIWSLEIPELRYVCFRIMLLSLKIFPTVHDQ